MSENREIFVRGGRPRAFFSVLLLVLISAVFSPATTGCSGGSAVTGADLTLGQKSTVYYIDDHLGSAQILTDSESGVLYEGMSAPYGLDLNGSAASEAESESADESGADYSYTTKEIDRETGLVYFGKRYYSPSMGRWLTPDPMFTEVPNATVEKPLSANLYAYVRNNPTNYVDPDGLVESSEFYLNRKSFGAQYTQNIIQGPRSPAEATFQQALGVGVISMVVAPIALPAVGALAPIASEAFLAGSIKAYGVGTVLSSVAMTEAGYLWNAGKETVMAAVQSVDVPSAVMAVNKVSDFVSGYSLPNPPQNVVQGFSGLAGHAIAIDEHYGFFQVLINDAEAIGTNDIISE